MFIVPYYIETPIKSKLFTTWKAWVFLGNGGTQVWMSEADKDAAEKDAVDKDAAEKDAAEKDAVDKDAADEAPKDVINNYLTPNGFTGKTRYDKKANCLYMEISPNTDFSDLYTWTECMKDAKDIPKEFILRPFVWIGDSPGVSDDWGWREQCEKVSLGSYGSIATLWDGIIKK